MSIILKSIEKYLPEKRIHSYEMDEMAGVKRGKIEKHTGVIFRHHISGTESVCSMGAQALSKALKSANLPVSSIDLLLFCGASFDYPVPHNAAIIKSLIADDSINFHCLDINSTCLSFLNALEIANMFINSKKYHRIAIVCSEASSKALTPNDELVFGLFGDAAVALILEYSESGGYQQTFSNFINYPSGSMLAHVPIGGAINRGIHTPFNDLQYFFKMDGRGLFRLTSKYIDAFVSNLEEKTKMKLNDFNCIITHQTSKMGNDFFRNHFKLPSNKLMETLPNFGNCISASIPLGLEIYFNNHKKLSHEAILLFGSGAGVSLGAMVLNFD